MPENFTIERVMEKEVLTAPPTISVMTAARMMAERGTGSVVIVNGHRPLGIFTERDLMTKCIMKNYDPHTMPVADAMTTDIVSIAPENTLEDAHQRMLQGAFRHLLVIKNRRLVGILSIKDLVRVREQVLEQRVREQTRQLKKTQLRLQESLDLLKREMESASKFQKDLINKNFPSPEKIRFSHVYEQASSLGGDFFSVSSIDTNHVGIFMADVMGHGITSAMIAIEVKMKFDQLYPRYLQPDCVITLMNRQLIPLMPAGFFVAGFYGIVDTDSLKMDYVQFGLPKPVILRAKSSKAFSLPPGNVPLGIRDNTQYVSRPAGLERGDRLLLFTDGCIEQKNRRGNLLGEKRFIRAFKRIVKDGKGKMAARLFREIREFAGGTPHNDDIAILLCEFL